MQTNLLYINHNYNNTNIIKYPVISDKALALASDNRYSFMVNPSSNKISIKLAIEELFNVKVIKINTCNIPKKKNALENILVGNQITKKLL